MNKKIYSLMIIISVLLSSCEKGYDLIPDNYDTILVLQESGEKKVTLYNAEDTGEYFVTVLKSGKEPESTAQVSLKVMDDPSFSVYSQVVGKTYTKLPMSTFEFKEGVIDFSQEEKYKKSKIVFKTPEIKKLLENNTSNQDYVLPIEMIKVNAKDSVNTEKNVLLLRPEVLTTSIQYPNSGIGQLNITDKAEEVYEFTLELPIVSRWDFECDIEVPNSVLTSQEYSFSSKKIIFKTGKKISEPIKIKVVKTANFVGNRTFLPIKIMNVSKTGIEFPKELFQLEILHNNELHKIPLNKNMLSTNAQEPSEGKIEGLVDNDGNTYFHSIWSSKIDKPHYFEIKLDKPISRVAFSYQNRNNGNGKPTEVKIWVSKDGNTWSELTQINSGLPIGAGSKYKSATFMNGEQFSYFRFEVLKTNGGKAPTFFNMAEFILYGK